MANTGKKIYFASDFHLGFPNRNESLLREKKVIKWLDTIKIDAEKLFLLGDIFDFWYEWKSVVPRGYTRFLGKLAELSDYGIEIHYFTGNHDVWAFNYLTEELNIIIHNNPIIQVFNNRKFYIGHGDGIVPEEKGFMFIKKCFTNKTLQWLFSRLHPNFAFWIANTWSRSSRSKHPFAEFKGKDGEYLYRYCVNILKSEYYDYFIFGHRHLPLQISLGNGSTYCNTGDWMNLFTYGIFDGYEMKIKSYESDSKIFTE